jgi:hypothetical protein
MIVTDATEAQVEFLREWIIQKTGGRFQGRDDASAFLQSTVVVGKEDDYQEAVYSENKFVEILLRHGVGKKQTRGIASIEVSRIPSERELGQLLADADAGVPDSRAALRQQMRAAFHLSFFDARLMETGINDNVVLDEENFGG